MFRISRSMQFLAKMLANPDPLPVILPKPKGPVVIWNLIRRCNLTCKHCYSISADKDFPGELNTQEVFYVLDDLKQFLVPAIIFSGGEPLLRSDIFEIAEKAKSMGFYTGLSTNGTIIDQHNIDAISQAGFDYIGISIDGIEATHDTFRRKEGAFAASMQGIQYCQEKGIKVGLRFTLTQDNAHELPQLLALMEQLDIDKFYLSHLNYAGRGNKNRGQDVIHQMSRTAMDLLFDTCWNSIIQGENKEFVTGNNDADGVYFLFWVQKNYPEYVHIMQNYLEQWGGNASGVNIANIDNLGEVHPDTFWWNYPLGNVRHRPFSQIWQDSSDPLMQGLKASPRPLEGRCAACQHQKICNGNTRVRAYQLTQNYWAEDPACYLSDEEIGVHTPQPRLSVTPYQSPSKTTVSS